MLHAVSELEHSQHCLRTSLLVNPSRYSGSSCNDSDPRGLSKNPQFTGGFFMLWKMNRYKMSTHRIGEMNNRWIV